MRDENKQIRTKIPTIEPLTSEVNDIDYLITVAPVIQSQAWEPEAGSCCDRSKTEMYPQNLRSSHKYLHGIIRLTPTSTQCACNVFFN